MKKKRILSILTSRLRHDVELILLFDAAPKTKFFANAHLGMQPMTGPMVTT